MSHAFSSITVTILEVLDEIKKTCSLDLLLYISWKDEYPEEAQAAFNEFCLRFDQDLLKHTEIRCGKRKLSETVALDIVQCTFARVWKYPSYNHKKSNAKTIENGIKRWLCGIVFTQMINYSKNGTCHEPDKESDLSLIYTLDEFVDASTTDYESRKLIKEKVSIIDSAIDSLSEKHRIIFLTYKLYTHEGNNIPRVVSKKLQEELGLVSASIRKYKEQANKQVANFLEQINAN